VIIPAIGIGPLGSSEWNLGGVGGLGASTTNVNAIGTGSGGGGGGGQNFGDALTNAINSMDQTQSTASVDATQVATGQSTDPTQAVTAVENASLQMDFASQIRNSIDTDATTLFQTQL
jgi:flagellar hook-basal body complex protein FliE